MTINGTITYAQLTAAYLYSEVVFDSAKTVCDQIASVLENVGTIDTVLQCVTTPSSTHVAAAGVDACPLLSSDEIDASGRCECRLLKLGDRGAAELETTKLKPPAAVWDEGMSLDCVSFVYPMRNRSVLRDVSINFSANQSTALVGTSGSGKSTAAALLARVLKPTSGTVRLGDFDVKDIDRDWMRHHLAQVPQSPTLFTASVFDNISYGFPEASVDDVQAAAKAADAHDFICRLPHGYSTIVKDSALSGGQRQRIAIARALFRQPRVLVWLLCLMPVLHQCSHTYQNLDLGHAFLHSRRAEWLEVMLVVSVTLIRLNYFCLGSLTSSCLGSLTCMISCRSLMRLPVH